MRNAVLIILISAFQVFATGSYSQTAQLSLKLKDATIKEVLTEIENQSEFYFLYNSELIDVTRKVDISVKNEKVNDILSRLFSDNEVNVSISDRHIVLTPVTEMSIQQQKSVSGKVTDTDLISFSLSASSKARISKLSFMSWESSKKSDSYKLRAVSSDS
jgi:DNA-binding TFAR19-related protein (PDSD5 family)